MVFQKPFLCLPVAHASVTHATSVRLSISLYFTGREDTVRPPTVWG